MLGPGFNNPSTLVGCSLCPCPPKVGRGQDPAFQSCSGRVAHQQGRSPLSIRTLTRGCHPIPEGPDCGWVLLASDWCRCPQLTLLEREMASCASTLQGQDPPPPPPGGNVRPMRNCSRKGETKQDQRHTSIGNANPPAFAMLSSPCMLLICLKTTA